MAIICPIHCMLNISIYAWKCISFTHAYLCKSSLLSVHCNLQFHMWRIMAWLPMLWPRGNKARRGRKKFRVIRSSPSRRLAFSVERMHLFMPLTLKSVPGYCFHLIHSFNKPVCGFERGSVSNAEMKYLKEENLKKILKVDRIAEKQPGSVTFVNIKGKSLAIF